MRKDGKCVRDVERKGRRRVEEVLMETRKSGEKDGERRWKRDGAFLPTKSHSIVLAI